MCDERTLREMEEYSLRNGSALTRRHFGALMIGAGGAASGMVCFGWAWVG